MANFEGLWIIGFALTGGFGGSTDYEVIEAETEKQANYCAYQAACEHYENYVGSYGLRSIEEIMEHDEICDEEIAREIFINERDSWIDYSAVPYSKEAENKIKGNSYRNKYKDRTDN